MAFIAAMSACTEPVVHQKHHLGIQKTEWLVGGKWTSRDSVSYYEEKWTKANDSTLTAIGYLTIGEDTVMYEEISLTERQGELVYAVKSRGQNDGGVVRFKATKNDEGYHVFENAAHDYPSKIIYARATTADSLMALVSGTRPDGTQGEDTFRLGRER